jgi:hypothetical protein
MGAFFPQSRTTDVLIDRGLVPEQLPSSTVVVPNNHFSRSTRLPSEHTIVSCEAYSAGNNLLTAERSGSIQKTAVSVDLRDQNARSALTFPTPRQSQRNFHRTSLFYCCSLILVVATLPDILTQLQITCIGPVWIRSGYARYTHSDTTKK